MRQGEIGSPRGEFARPGAFCGVLKPVCYKGLMTTTTSASPWSLAHLPAAEVLGRLDRLVTQDRRLTAVLLAHLAEVDARQLYLEAACSSTFGYCVERLHFSEDAAYKRVRAARAARQFPRIFELVARGELHLAAVTLLAPHLTEDNHRDLLAAAAHQSTRAVEELDRKSVV